ncbi:MAG: DMT family transporter [Acidobacteriota bacterium]|nr:DMT family transporter [Acidobacteriota bacterium]
MSNSKTTQSSESAGWVSDVALVALALMWGTSHVVTKEILAAHSPAFYTSLRFGIAAICFAVVFSGHLRRASLRQVKQGVLLGLLSFTGIAFYVLGLNFTQASKAGFITGLYLVFTPLIGFALFKVKPTRDHLTGLAVAIAGFTLLSFPRSGEAINWGDVLVLLAAVAWASHIAATSAFAAAGDVRTLAAFQVMTVAVLALTVLFVLRALGLETRPNPIDRQFIWQIGYMAVMVTFVAALLQTWAQSRVNPTHAVILYALEPATAAVFAYYVFGETLSFWRGIGAALIVVGVMLSRLKVASRLTGSEKVNSLPLEADC